MPKMHKGDRLERQDISQPLCWRKLCCIQHLELMTWWFPSGKKISRHFLVSLPCYPVSLNTILYQRHGPT